MNCKNCPIAGRNGEIKLSVGSFCDLVESYVPSNGQCILEQKIAERDRVIAAEKAGDPITNIKIRRCSRCGEVDDRCNMTYDEYDLCTYHNCKDGGRGYVESVRVPQSVAKEMEKLSQTLKGVGR